MRKSVALFLVVLLLSGCKSLEDGMAGALTLRQSLLRAENTTFQCEIIADYGDYVHTFTLDCCFDSSGNMEFSVIKPETISGITGKIDTDGGKLTFDDKILGFPVLADGYLSPVSAPWLFLKTLRSGYLDACGSTNDGWLISANDSYENNTMHLQIFTDAEFKPLSAEFLWDGRRILSINISNFSYL